MNISKKLQLHSPMKWVIAIVFSLVMSLIVFSVTAFAGETGEGVANEQVGEIVETQVDGLVGEELTNGPDGEESVLENETPASLGEPDGSETPEVSEANGGETFVDVEITSGDETIKAATEELEHEYIIPQKGALNDAIQAAIAKALEEDKDIATVILKAGVVYTDKAVLDESEGISRYVIKSEDDSNPATLNAKVEVTGLGVVATILNVLFGQDCILQVDDSAKLIIGKENERTSGEIKIIAGGEADETKKGGGGETSPEGGGTSSQDGTVYNGPTKGTATVYAGNNASVKADIIKGTVTIINSIGDSIVFHNNNSVGIYNEEESQTTEKKSDITISSRGGDNTVNIKYIEAWDANVYVKGHMINLEEKDEEFYPVNLDGEPKTNNSTGNYLRSLKVIAASENSTGILSFTTGDLGLEELLAKIGITDIFSIGAIKEKAEVNINGDIVSREDIIVYSYTTQTKTFLSTDIVNLGINIKSGEAVIKVKEGVKLEAGRDIILKATTRSRAGYDENGQAQTGVLPLAFNIFIEDASIILNGATLNAGRDITADVLSTIEANASCSFGSLFVGVAFNVIVNDALLDVVGARLTAGGNINLISKAYTEAIADAERSAFNDSLDGLYFATNVVIQNSNTNIGNNTVMNAGGDVNISSTSDVDATDDAIASAPSDSENVSALPLTSVLKTIGYELLDKVTERITPDIGLPETKGKKLKKAMSFFDIDGYTIEIDSASQEKGTVKATTVDSTDGQQSNSAKKDKLIISVDSNYKVNQVLVRYLPVSSTEYKFAKATLNAQTGKYELNLKEIIDHKTTPVTLNQFRVYVLYSDEMKSEVEMKEMPSEESDDGDFGIADLFDSAVESAGDDSDSDSDCGGSIILTYVNKKNTADGDDTETSKVLTDAMVAGVSENITSISALKGVAAGKKVRFNASCKIGWSVKSMTASYTNNSGEIKEITIEKNNNGHYVLEIPSDIKDNALKITTIYEERESTEKPSENQITGALGVGVVVNNNNAVVDLGEGSITAVGNVNINAEATSNLDTTADGSAVTQYSIDAASTTFQMAEGEDLDVQEVKVKVNDEETGTILYVYGKSTGENAVTAILEGTKYTITLAPDAEFGFLMPKTITIIILGEDNREHEIEITGENGVYIVDTKYIDFKNDEITDTEQDSSYIIRSTKFIAIYGSNIYKVKAEPVTEGGKYTTDRSSTRGRDTITINPTPKEGYAIDSMGIDYKINGQAQIPLAFVPAEIKDGYYICTLPEDSVLATWDKDPDKEFSMVVWVKFKKISDAEKITINVDGSISQFITVDKTKGTSGEKITIKLTEGGKNQKIDISKFHVTFTTSEGQTANIDINPNDFSFTIPVKGITIDGKTITVNADLGYTTEMKVPLSVKEGIANGTVTIENKKNMTGEGDVFYVKVKGNDGYVLKVGTLVAEYKNGEKTIKLAAPKSLSGGLYKFTVPTEVGNNGGSITINAEFTDEEPSSSSTGIAIAVNVDIHKNNALIKSGTISGGNGISLLAITNGKAVTEAKAGFSSAKTGIAGAIAVDVANYKTYASIGEGVVLKGREDKTPDLSVDAKSNISSFKTDANASSIKSLTPSVSDATAGKTGVGTGIAVAVNGVKTIAAINKGVVWGYVRPIGDISVTAANTLKKDEVNAIAGTKSKKTAVTPVVALNIINSNAKAYIGTFKDSVPMNADSVNIKALNQANHNMTVNTISVTEGGVAMAGSFGINIIDDSAKAILESPVVGAGSDVTVDAQSISTLKGNVAASAAGAGKGSKTANDSKGSADKKADNIISGGQKIGAKAGMGAPTSETVNNRQQAQTSEGTIAGAAAFVLNIQKNKSEAIIEDGVTLGNNSTKIGDVTVASRGMTSADITADGSATRTFGSDLSKTGIGVAVAINIVTSTNSAYIGNGLLKAGKVLVTVVPTVDADGKKQSSKFVTSSISGASASGVSVAGSVALAVLNNTASAVINKAEADTYNASSTILRVEDLRTAETTASASKAESGKPDKNNTKALSDKNPEADMSKSVGVGASFAMVYGDNNVFAKFIAPKIVNDDTNIGEIIIEVISDHSEETTAVAGTDPYQELFPEKIEDFRFAGPSTAITIDAAVAVNAIHSMILAQLAALAEAGYTPTVYTGSVVLNASEKGHSKTDSSGYAMGTKTAVGGSVAINLNVSSARAHNGCSLNVSGDEIAGDDDGEVHRESVEITASSSVTEENIAYALAAGGDIIRYLEKYKSMLTQIASYKAIAEKIVTDAKVKAEQIAQMIQSFLDGSYFKEIEDQYKTAVKEYQDLYNELQGDIEETGKADPEKEKTLSEKALLAMNSGNALASKIMGYLAAAKRIQTLGSQVYSLSSTLLKLLNVGTPSTGKMDETTGKATSEANSGINGSGTSGEKTEVANNGNVNKESESLQIAAAIGVAVSQHEIIAENCGEIITRGGVKISAENSIDAIAHSKGFAASINGGFGSIALAIAVKVDDNSTKAISYKNITVGKGKDVIISAIFNENTHDFSDSEEGVKTDYTKTIGTEAIAGAVAGGATVAISGAVVVFVSNSEVIAELADEAIIMAAGNDMAGNVSITAEETSRQTMRTTSFSGSTAKLTMGISAGILVTENVIRARVGKYTIIKATNISVEAQRKSVSLDNDTGLDVKTTEGTVDFGNGDGDAGDKEGTTGVDVKGSDGDPLLNIDTNKATSKSANGIGTISVNIDKDKITDMLENVFNRFSYVDYYIAVDSGAVAVGSPSKGVGSIAGSVVVATINNTVEAIIDQRAQLISSEDIDVKATSAEQTRLISGAISTSPSGGAVSVGAVIAFLYEKNIINAIVNDYTVLTAGKDIIIFGQNTGRSEVYTVTASGSVGGSVGTAATIDVILSEAKVNVMLGNPVTGEHTAQTAYIVAENSKALRNITVSISAGSAGVQVGGAVAVILEDSEAIVTAENTVLNVNGKEVACDAIVIKANNTHDMFIIVCSASVAAGSSANVAGVVSIILDESAAKISTLGAKLTSNVKTPSATKGGNIVIAASNDSDLLNVNVEAAIGQAAYAVGASVTVNILKREVINDVSTKAHPTYIELNNGNISLTADAADKVIVVAAGANGSSGMASIQGTILVLVENNTARVTAADTSCFKIGELAMQFDSGSVTVAARFNGGLYGVAGGVNFNIGSLAAGATIVVAVTNNNTVVDISNSNISCSRKIDILSAADTKTLLISIGAAVSSSVAVEGSVLTVVASDNLRISLGAATLESGSITINAKGKSSETYVSGAITGSGGVSVGPSVLVFVKERNVKIESASGGTIGGVQGCNVTALAEADDDIFTLVLAMAASGGVSVSAGICTEVINNTVLCDIKADINAGDKDITIGAKSDRNVSNYIFGGGFGPDASVVPVVTVIYLQDNVASIASGDAKGYKVSVTADTLFKLREVAAGVALSGLAGISGTFAIVVNESNTKAEFTGSYSTGSKSGSELNVLANDSYKFNSLIANLSVGVAGAGVGVTAAITVVKNTTSAIVGAENGERKTIDADKINVKADSVRDIINKIGVLSGGAVGASVNVAVIVAGSRISQDAYDMLTSPDGKSNTFSSDSVLNAVKGSNSYVKNNNLISNVTLGEDIKGNGQRDSAIEVENVQGAGFVSELADDKTEGDYEADSDTSATEGTTLRGEESDISPDQDESVNKNAQAGKNAGYTYDANDAAIIAAVIAKVQNVIINCTELSITANDEQTAEIDSVTGAAGIEVGAALGVSVIVLHSDVMAVLAENAEVTCSKLDIIASSGGNGVNVIGGVAGVGSLVGAGVAVGVVHLDDTVTALLAGKVTARNIDTLLQVINVIAKSNYNNVKAETVSFAAGFVGAAASVAVVSLNGSVKSLISGEVRSVRDGSGKVVNGFNEVNVFTFFNNSVDAIAASLGSGAISGAVGVAIISETLCVETGIAQGAIVELDGKNATLRVLNAGDYDGNNISQGIVKGTAQVASVSVGLVAGGFAVAVAYIEPTITACIAGTVQNALGGLMITVGNNILTESNTGLFSGQAGKGAFGANVLISWNTTKANSTVTGSVQAESLTVMSLITANAISKIDSVQVAGLAFGVSVALSILNAENIARVGSDADIKVGTLSVLAGAADAGLVQDGGNFFAEAKVFAGSVVPGLNVDLNVAVALNKALNKAELNATRNVWANVVNVKAYGNPTAKAEAKVFSLDLIGLAGSAAASTLSFTQEAIVNCTNLRGLKDGSLTEVNITTYMYPGEAKDSDGQKFDRDYNQAYSDVDIYAIEGLSIGANVSYAKNKTRSIINAVFGTNVGKLEIRNNGSANALANISDAGLSLVGIGANVVLGYVQAVFSTLVSTNGVKGDINIDSDFVSNAHAIVKAANDNLVGLKANVIVAKSTTVGSTILDGNGKDIEASRIQVYTHGNSTTCAEVLKPGGTFSVVTLAANIVESILSAKQEAIVRNINVIGAPRIDVNSNLNSGETRVKHSALAKFEGAPNATTIRLGNLEVNVILAKNYATNHAELSGITSSGKIGEIVVLAQSNANAFADAGTADPSTGKLKDSNGLDISLISIGVVVAISSNESKNIAEVKNLKANVSSLSVEAIETDASANSYGGTSSHGVGNLVGINANVSKAFNKAENRALISDCSGTIDTIVMLADAEDVHATAHIGSAKITVSGITVAVNIVEAINNYKGSAVIENSNLTGSSLTVQSFENRHYYESDTYNTVTSADVGSAGGEGITISLISGKVNKAKAENTSEIKAYITGSVLSGYAVAIIADGRSEVSSKIDAGSNIGLVNVAVVSTEAYANGTVIAGFEPTSTKSNLASLSITAFGSADAEAITGVVGSVAEAITIESNKAISDVNMIVKAILSGGKLNVANEAAITSMASAISKAEAIGPKFALDILRVAVNEVIAYSNIQVTSDVLPGEYTFGSLVVKAGIPTDQDVRYPSEGRTVYFDNSSTIATVHPSSAGTPNKSVRISLIDGSCHTSEALSAHLVTVNIGKDGAGTITAGSIAIDAFGNAKTNAVSQDVDSTYGLASIGSLKATALERDITEVFFNAGSIVSNGLISVKSRNASALVEANGSTPGGFNAAAVYSTKMYADILNVARITLTGNITSDSINLEAANDGEANTALIPNGSMSALATINDAEVPVVEKFTTEIVFAPNSIVKANNSLRLSTDTNSKTYSNVRQETGAAIFDETKLVGKSTVDATNKIKIGSGAKVSAGNEIDVIMTHRGAIKSSSDYRVAEFELIGANNVKSYVDAIVRNIIEMEAGSSLYAEKESINIEQNSSSLLAISIATSASRKLAGVAKCTGIINFETDNNLQFADIRAGKSINICQYGGTIGAAPNGVVTASDFGGTSSATSENHLRINNVVKALDEGDLVAPEILIVQGVDNLQARATAQGDSDGILYAIVKGTAENDIKINNTLEGGSKEIGVGQKRIYVTYVGTNEEDNEILVGMEALRSGFITFDKTTAKNSLVVTSTDVAGTAYKGFAAYMDKFNEAKIGKDEKTKEYSQNVSYSPSGLDTYFTKEDPSGKKNKEKKNDSPNYWVTPANPTVNNNGKTRKFLDLFEQILFDGLGLNGGSGQKMKMSIDKDGYLVIKDSTLFATEMDYIDSEWLYELLTGKNISFMTSYNLSETIKDTDAGTLITALAKGSLKIKKKDIIIKNKTIILTFTYKGKTHSIEIKLGNANKKVSAYLLENGKKIPVSLIVVEKNGKNNVIIYTGDKFAENEFVYVSELINGKKHDIKVKVKEEFFEGLNKKIDKAFDKLAEDYDDFKEDLIETIEKFDKVKETLNKVKNDFNKIKKELEKDKKSSETKDQKKSKN